MKAMDLIKSALEIGDKSMMMLIDDLRNAPMAQPMPGGNHPMWVLGHITFIEANLPHVLSGEPNPLADWAAKFAPGTQPKTEPSAYPAFDEVIRQYKESREKNLKLLDQIGEAGLDRPTKYPPRGLEEVFKTVGDAFHVLAMHQMSHRGQLADARRALGRAPIFTPGIN
jgi:uncharacterized damage-inducible protein DinB